VAGSARDEAMNVYFRPFAGFADSEELPGLELSKNGAGYHHGITFSIDRYLIRYYNWMLPTVHDCLF
jgi:hypothetical protein